MEAVPVAVQRLLVDQLLEQGLLVGPVFATAVAAGAQTLVVVAAPRTALYRGCSAAYEALDALFFATATPVWVDHGRLFSSTSRRSKLRFECGTMSWMLSTAAKNRSAARRSTFRG